MATEKMSEKFIEAGPTGGTRLFLLRLDVRDEVRAMGARLNAHYIKG